jgi:pyruvate/2-oxoglutarate dehydrogenase complex dihydrolipoamide acyltransferase (E2) component
MKFEITEAGVRTKNAAGEDERVEVGTVIDVKGDAVPGYLVGKGVVIGAKAAAPEKKAESKPASAAPAKPAAPAAPPKPPAK